MRNSRLHILMLVLALIIGSRTMAQDAPALVQAFSTKMSQAKAFSTEFIYTTNNQVQRGKVLVKDRMYKMDLGNTLVMFNGTLRWTYIKEANEVTIHRPDPLKDGLLANPTAIFAIDMTVHKATLKSKETVSGKSIANIQLVPTTPNDAYSTIMLGLDIATKLPVYISYHNTDGSRIDITIVSFNDKIDASAKEFTFDPSLYPGIEVIDMR